MNNQEESVMLALSGVLMSFFQGMLYLGDLNEKKKVRSYGILDILGP
jgi:hypothetical protein